MTGRRRLPLGLGLGIAALALAAYGGVFRLGFVFDDADYILGNRRLHEGITLAAVRWAFTAVHACNWHPLTWLSHLADVALFGLRPAGHHATSLLVHLANGVLLFLVLRSMTGATWRSGMAAALFVVHPLHVESVAWVAERKDVLSTFFGLLTLAAYRRYSGRPSIPRYLVVAAVLSLGLMAKSMLVTLPFVLLLLDFWPLGRVIRGGGLGAGDLARRSLEKAPLLLLSAASSVVTFLAQKSGGALLTGETYPLPARAANALIAPVRYLGATLWPHGLSPWYPLPADGHPAWKVWGAGALLLCLTALALRLARHRPFLCTGWLWFLGTLVPVIGVVQVGLQAMADRYTYIPHIGLTVAFVWGTAAISEPRRSLRVAAAGAGALILGPLVLATWRQVPHWRDDFTLYRRAVTAVPGNWFMHYNLGTALEREGKTREAMAQYEEVLRLRPAHADAHFNLGVILGGLGRKAEAISHYRTALHLRPDDADTHNNLGALLVDTGRLEEAVPHFREALRLRPEHHEARVNLGRTLVRLGGRP